MESKQFWCSDIAHAAALSKAEHPEAVRHTLETARQVCENTFVFTRHWDMERCTQPVVFEGEIDWEYRLNGDPEWLYQMNRHGFLLDLAKAFCYTGEQIYADCFARLVSDWIARAPLTAQSEETTWRSLEAGLRCANWLRGMALLGDALPPALAEKMRGALRVHGEYLARKSGDFHILSNWGVLQDEGLFLLSLAFDRDDWRELALRRLCVNLHWQVMDDGSHWEQSPMYHGEVLHCFLQVAAVARHCGVALPQEYTQGVHKMCTALAFWTMPGGVLPCQSDTDAIDARDLIAKGAVLFGDARLKAFAGARLYEENVWDFNADELAAYRALQPAVVEEASTALPDSGNYVLRTGIGAADNALRFHCGCLGSGHGHADLLHVDLRAYGEDILVDAGRYTYMNTEQRLHLKSVFAHNTTTVDGLSYTQPRDTWGYETLAQPLPCTHKFTPSADAVCGAHVGYLEQGSGVLVQRKAVFLKPDITVLFDMFYTAPGEKHSYAQYFHFSHTGRVSALQNADECGVRFAGEHAQAQLLVLSGGSCEVSACEVSPRYNELVPAQRLAVTTQGEGFTSLVTVLATAPVGQALSLQAALCPVTMLRSKKTLSPAKAQGVCVTLNGESYTVIACHGESISEVDMLCCNGVTGYGKLLAFTPKTPQGICLAW